MNRIHLIAFAILITVLPSFKLRKEFPVISYQTIDGRTVTNDYFKSKKTIVVMGHLGCPALMVLMRDIESIKPEEFQFLIILENTPQQVRDFNSAEKNDWSAVRHYFKMQPVTMDIIAECETENIKREGDKISLVQQCRKLSGKIKTKSSPTILYVDTTGNIYKRIEGYYGDNEQAERVNKLFNDN